MLFRPESTSTERGGRCDDLPDFSGIPAAALG